MSDVETVVRAVAEFREAELRLWRRAGAALNLTLNAMLALAAILRGEAEGAPLRQVDVREQLMMSPAGVSATINELERRGFVRREPDPADRRAMRLRAGEHAGPIAERLANADVAIRAKAEQFTPEMRGAIVAILDEARGYGDRTYPQDATSDEA